MHNTSTSRVLKKTAALLLPALALTTTPLSAALYWDLNGTTAGAGGTPTGTWDAASLNWNTDSTGILAPGLWTAGETAVFSAGNDATNAFTVTLSGSLTAGGLTIEEGSVALGGTGAVALGASPITINAGTTLSTNSNARITTTAGSVLTINGGTLQTTNTGSAGTFFDTDTQIVLGAAGGTFSHTTANILNIVQTASVITGTGSLTKTGVGVLAIAGTASHSGPTFINEGELRIRGTANRLPTGTAVTVTSPGILNLNSVAQQIGSLSGNGSVGLGSATLTVGDSTNTTFTGVIANIMNAGANGVATGAGRILKQGSGELTLTGINTYTGSFTITNGTVTVTSTGSLCGPIADLAINGGVLNLNNSAQTVENLAGTGGVINLGTGHTLTTDPAANATYAGTIAGSGNLIKANVLSGTTVRTLTLSGNNTYDGITTIAGGILQAASATALGSTVGYTEVAAGGELRIDGAAQTFTLPESIQIAGAGAGGGGAITIQNSAAPILSGPIALAANATVTVSGASTGTFTNADAFTGTTSTLTLQGGSGAGSGGRITGAISLGTGGLTKLQGGRWILSGANTYSGVTTISAGTLQFAQQVSLYNNVTSAWTDAQIAVASGATLALNVGGAGEFTSANIDTLSAIGSATAGFASGAILGLDTTNAGGTFTHGGVIANPNAGANALSVTKLGIGTLVLSAANTFTGTTTVTDGTLAESSTGSLADTSNLTVSGSTSVFSLGADHSDTVGTVTLSGGGNIIGTGTSALTSTGTFALQNGTVSAILAGIGIPLNKTTTGVVTLSGANIFTGDTIISAGTLLVTGSLNGTAKVDVTGILGGTGTITPVTQGNINLLTGGKLSPGTGVGNLTLAPTGGGVVNLTGATDAVNSQALVFELDTVAASDRITLASGSLGIGLNTLEFDDFAFSLLGGFGNGDYVLFDGVTPITTSFGPNISGTLGGLDANLQFGDNGNDIILHVVPEPGSAALLIGGLALLARRRRRE